MAGAGLCAAALVTAGAANATSSFAVTPLAGANRFATAAAIAAKAFPTGADTVIVASGLDTNLSDSLAASYLAAQENGGKGAPILLTNPNSVPTETTTALQNLKATKVVIVGGTGAVSESVAVTIGTSGASGGTIAVSRVGSANRFLTADAIDSVTSMTAVGSKHTAIVADGLDQNLVDALGASPLAAAGPYPLFLVNGPTGTLSTTDLSIMKTDGITNVILVGGSAAIGSQVATTLTAAVPTITSVQEAGANRSATSEKLADYEIANYGFSKTTFDIASGDQSHLVDSLSGGPLGGARKAPTLITLSVDNAGDAATFAGANSATEASAYLFGGTGSVDSTATMAIEAAAKGTSTTTTTMGTGTTTTTAPG